MSADRIEEACEVMHDAYEAAAVGASWETQQASRKPWADVPEANKATMRAAVGALLNHLSFETRRLQATVDALIDKAPEERLLEAIFATSGCRCGCGAPRWDENKTVLRFGWDTPDRCGRCGEEATP